MPQAKTEVALQFWECCAAEVALQHWLFCSADNVLTKSCAAKSEKLQCNIAKAALQESGAFLPLPYGFQAPTLDLLILHFLGKIAVQKMSGKTPGSPRHPSSRHPRPSDGRPPGYFRVDVRDIQPQNLVFGLLDSGQITHLICPEDVFRNN